MSRGHVVSRLRMRCFAESRPRVLVFFFGPVGLGARCRPFRTELAALRVLVVRLWHRA